jgi:hypothetical protein
MGPQPEYSVGGESPEFAPGGAYEAPAIVDIGSLHELTQAFNKIGGRQDAASHIIPGMVGSIVAVR